MRSGFEGGLTCTMAALPTLTIDVCSALVQPVFRLNGVPFDLDPMQSGAFFLVPPVGQPVLLGSSFSPPSAGVRVVTGVYDVEYCWRAGDRVPSNTVARVLQNVLIAGDSTLVVDVPSTSLRGNFTMNGAAFPQTDATAAAALSLSAIHGLGRVVLGNL